MADRNDPAANPFGGSGVRNPRRLEASPTLVATRPEQHAAAFVYDNGGSSVVQSIPNNAVTTVTWDTALFDTHGLFDNANDRFTVPASGKVTGLWVVHARVAWAANATGVRELRIAQGAFGVPHKVRQGAQNIAEQTLEAILYLRDPTPGLALSVQVFQDSGAALDLVKVDALSIVTSSFSIFHLW